MPMSMTLKFRNLAQFFFMEWQSQDALGLILGCVCCMVLAFLMMAMPEIKRRLLKFLATDSSEASIITDGDEKAIAYEQLNFKQKVANVFVCISHAFLHVVLMVIIMNMNFYVIFAIVIGATLGYLSTSDEYCAKKENHACCGHQNSAKQGYNSVVQFRELLEEQTDRL